MARLHRTWLQTGLAFMIGAISVLPTSGHASQGPVDASTLGLREPNAQEIQAEIDLVHSQGIAITVVGHFIRPTMTVRTAQGQAVLAANVPVVEFVVGYIPAHDPGAEPTATRSGAAIRAGLPRGAAPAAQPAAHSGMHPRDYFYRPWWQDNANGPAGGYPTFYYSAHYNMACIKGSCTEHFLTINHQANTAPSGYTLNGNWWSLSCSPSFDNSWWGSGNSWGVGYHDSALGLSCPQYSTYMWERGDWSKGSSHFISYFTDNHQGTTIFPGDYLRF